MYDTYGYAYVHSASITSPGAYVKGGLKNKYNGSIKSTYDFLASDYEDEAYSAEAKYKPSISYVIYSGYAFAKNGNTRVIYDYQ